MPGEGERGYQPPVEVSSERLEFFRARSFFELAQRFHIDILELCDDPSMENIERVAHEIEVTLYRRACEILGISENIRQAAIHEEFVD